MYVDDATDKTKAQINETVAEKILRCGCKPKPGVIPTTTAATSTVATTTVTTTTVTTTTVTTTSVATTTVAAPTILGNYNGFSVQ